jgi:DNA-directed RNA polymerase specialized sigma24 family protein
MPSHAETRKTPRGGTRPTITKQPESEGEKSAVHIGSYKTPLPSTLSCVEVRAMPHPGDSGAGPWKNGGAGFRTTHWSLVRAASGSSPDESMHALELLCRSYWYPVYAHIRRWGYNPEDAQDLAQGFFAELLEKHRLAKADEERGRFRSFLLASVNHFLSHERDKANTLKRGGTRLTFSLDALEPEDRYLMEPATQASPDVLFDQQWAHLIMERVLGTIRSEMDLAGQIKRFDILKHFLLGERGDLTLQQAANQLGTTETAIKSAVHRLRLRFRELFTQEIAETLIDPSDLEGEMRHLLQSLRSGL